MRCLLHLGPVIALIAVLFSLTGARAEQVGNPPGQELELAKVMAQANAGDANAQNMLGALYQTGNGVVRSDEEAARWYSKAADQGHAAAQANLGAMYMAAQGVPQDSEKGVELLKLSAAQQLPLGIARLGAAYLQGWGIEQDAQKGQRMLLDAVDLGVGLAAYELGRGHLYGNGVAKDEEAAKAWFRKSAELGYPNGQYVYARKYEMDGAVRLELYQKAATGGHPGAQYELGSIYEDKSSPIHDLDMAVHWYSMAALNGNEMGNQARFKLGLPDVNGNMPINSKVMTSSAPTEKMDAHTTVFAFAAFAAIAILLTTTGGSDAQETPADGDDFVNSMLEADEREHQRREQEKDAVCGYMSDTEKMAFGCGFR